MVQPQARQAGVPVPEVLWLGTADITAGPRTMTASHGGWRGAERGAAGNAQPVSAPPPPAPAGRSSPGCTSARSSAGSTAAALTGASSSPTLPPCGWPIWRTGSMAPCAVAGWGLTPAEVRQAEGLLPEAVAARGDGPAVLCHGELFPGHIFVAVGDGDHSREHQPVGPMADRLQILMTAQRLNGRGGGEQPRPGGSVQRDT